MEHLSKYEIRGGKQIQKQTNKRKTSEKNTWQLQKRGLLNLWLLVSLVELWPETFSLLFMVTFILWVLVFDLVIFFIMLISILFIYLFYYD